MTPALNILVIEDKQTDFRLMTRHLDQHGVTACYQRAVNMEELLAALDNGSWDVVISDFTVPRLDFAATLQLLQTRLPDQPLILVSGSIGEEKAVELLKLGVWDFVLKDNLVRLVPALERCLREASDRRARHSAEAALRESEAHYRLLAENAEDFVSVIDPQENRIYVSPSFYRVTGWTAEEVIRSPWDTRMHPDEIPLIKQARAANLAGQTTLMEHRTRCKDGSWMWVESRCKPLFDSQGKVVQLLIWQHDITARKQAEDTLRRSESALRDAQRLAKVGNWEQSASENLLIWSDELYRIYGRDPALGPTDMREISSYFTPETWARLSAAKAQVLTNGVPYECDAEMLRGDGVRKWITSRGEAMKDASGRIIGIRGTTQDITERKRVEALRQALLSLGARLNNAREPLAAGRALLTAADQLWKWDAATLDVVTPNSSHVQPVLRVDIVDGQRRELVQSEPLTHPTPRMQRVMKQGAELILRDNTSSPAEGMSFGDSSRLSASILCVPIRRETQTVGVLSIQSYSPNAYTPEDLHTLQALADYCGGALERIRSETELRASEERYRGLVETTFDWIWEVDAKARYTYASPKVKELLGYAPEEVLGRTPFDLMPPAEAQRVGAIFGEIAAKRESFSALENTNLSKDGRLVVLETSGVPVLGPDGQFRGYRGMDHDVTLRRQLEAQLRQAQKLEAIGQLAGGVAHDFNNILAAIMMHLGLLQMNPNLDAETREFLNDLDAEAHRAANLTRQLLMFSRRSVLTVKPLDLNAVVADLLKMLTRLIGEHIDLRFDGKSALPMVRADAGMLEQVLMNLVVNARDAMPKGGRITISTTVAGTRPAQTAADPNCRTDSFVCLSVSDTGSGMDEITLKRIFEPFFTTKEVGKGTGLGLATVHGIVAQHKGWVEVDSQVGLGTTFRVYLPATPAAAEAAPLQQSKSVRGGRETILLVEDETAVRRAIGQTLRALGYVVYEATNGQEAMSLWQVHGAGVDLLFTDIVMPEGMTGLELAEQLRTLKPGLKAIISSGYSAEIAQAGLPSESGVIYLPKPFEAKVLASVVRDCLDKR